MSTRPPVGSGSFVAHRAPAPMADAAFLQRAEVTVQQFMQAGRFDDAERVCREVLAVVPDHIGATMTLMMLFFERGKHENALEVIEHAIRIDPNNPNLHTWRGMILFELRRFEPMEAAFRRAIELSGLALFPQPFVVNARFALASEQCRMVYRDEEELEARRDKLAEQLDALGTYYASASREECAAAAKELRVRLPILLGYHGKNDRELKSRLGKVLVQLMSAALPQWSTPRAMPTLAPGERVRLGFASATFHRHSVWKVLLRGWLRELDRKKFEIFAYNIDGRVDEQTSIAGGLCDTIENRPLSVDGWAERIGRDNLHVLVYPELGTHLNTYRLAALRLAPVQCASWGHPETTGLPTIDYFLSSDRMEPGNAEDFYTEKLVRLPNLGVHYEPLADVAPVLRDRQSFGLRPDAILYWSPNVVGKYLPQYDELFARIAEEVPSSQIVFLDLAPAERQTDAFVARLKKAFDARKVSFEKHVCILPALSPADFAAVTHLMNVALDSVGWSGCNTTFESLQVDVPVVTMAGDTMRSRRTQAILTRMGLTETIATTPDEYVAIAVRLGTDAAWRAEIASKVAHTKERCYRDPAPVAELGAFFERCARG